ncbi:Transposase IS200 like protein [Legionella santicrucis]|uniref:Transposase IS200 like protein n=1 Tax=Legionella santicrucis TaxID=45074 RepID=A0A0W0ZKK7_9GAMM|nr:transposase [Legionella santicrucis]KTD69855.1 Transposase IS200 like protein [Legionella santicrucis]
MVNYRRDKTRGAAYFFTLVLKNRKSDLLTKYITLLGRSIRRAKKNNFFIIKSIVVLPDHLHMIMELPEGDLDYSTRVRQLKTYFSQEIQLLGIPLLQNDRNEYNLWQRRFWEHRLRDESDLSTHVDYIHFNPVKHGLVKNVINWPYSSFHKYVSQDILPKNWGGESLKGDFGE